MIKFINIDKKPSMIVKKSLHQISKVNLYIIKWLFIEGKNWGNSLKKRDIKKSDVEYKNIIPTNIKNNNNANNIANRKEEISDIPNILWKKIIEI
jgi:hypothetical protein